ncbi:sugar-binding transcriptional regulator [Carnobacterium sp. CS13]|uniref:sugar-binding transcriptional regulator n=1 Tax=Carnobacterium sp. CS13 TaxID=2800128 RepID=UPI001914C01A|nr:sugar-binding transcriptional regulator [Carnobacterium sp. CS13]QQP70672.1 sugar-binding transcriptional regulator [Carnobacterium sp. CS13]
MENKEKEQFSIEVARLYYESDYSQQEIANKLGISRPTVSRLLKSAKDKGYVQIKITDPFSDLAGLGTALRNKYDLLEAHIVFSPESDYQSITEYLSRFAAEYLEETIQDGTTIGVSWGTTMYEIARKIAPENVNGIEVVQLKGGISHSKVNTYANETISLFAKAFQTTPINLPLPVIFDNVATKELVEQDRHIQHIIEKGRQATVAVFTVGTVRENALLFRLGYFDKKEMKQLKENAVGDICSRFFDKTGKISNDKINNRTIGIDLEELKHKEKSILVAGGHRKIQAIDGALKGKYANVLITDQFTAKELLDKKD